MQRHKPLQSSVRLYETTIAGRLETLEQVQAMLERLDDIQPSLGGWRITCRQTRQETKKPEQAKQGRRMIP